MIDTPEQQRTESVEQQTLANDTLNAEQYAVSNIGQPNVLLN